MNESDKRSGFPQRVRAAEQGQCVGCVVILSGNDTRPSTIRNLFSFCGVTVPRTGYGIERGSSCNVPSLKSVAELIK